MNVEVKSINERHKQCEEKKNGRKIDSFKKMNKNVLKEKMILMKRSQIL